jgi:hypothetical protein
MLNMQNKLIIYNNLPKTLELHEFLGETKSVMDLDWMELLYDKSLDTEYTLDYLQNNTINQSVVNTFLMNKVHLQNKRIIELENQIENLQNWKNNVTIKYYQNPLDEACIRFIYWGPIFLGAITGVIVLESIVKLFFLGKSSDVAPKST